SFLLMISLRLETRAIRMSRARAPNSTGAPSLVSSRSPGARRKGPNDSTSLLGAIFPWAGGWASWLHFRTRVFARHLGQARALKSLPAWQFVVLLATANRASQRITGVSPSFRT